MRTIADKRAIIELHQQSTPVQTVPLAKALGLNVYHVPGWPDDLSGMIRRDDREGGPSGFVIYVNAGHHVNRRRFTTAHEIAHYILHEDQIGDGVADDALYRSRLSNRMEWQANELAADILMPWHLINQATANGHASVEALAPLFQVSNSAMSIRLGVPYER